MPTLDYIDDDEELYRRVTPEHYTPGVTTFPDPEAFHPHKTRDEKGISLYRAGVISVERAQKTEYEPAKYRHLAVLNAGSIRRELGLELVPDLEKPGHVYVANLNSKNRRCPESKERKLRLAQEFVIRMIPAPETPELSKEKLPDPAPDKPK